MTHSAPWAARPGAIALTRAILAIGFATYEARYTDASGSRCLTFTIGNREADLCSGAIDRPAPWPAALPTSYPYTWTPEGGAK